MLGWLVAGILFALLAFVFWIDRHAAANQWNPSNGVLENALKRAIWKVWGSLGPEVTIPTKQGRLTVPTADFGIGRELHFRGEHEYTFSRACIALLRKHAYLNGPITFLDVGANIGHIGIGLLLAGDVERVIAVEPEPRTLDLLKRNVNRNNLDSKIEIVHAAAGAERGTLKFALHRWNYGDHHVAAESDANTIAVPCVPLDDIRGEVSMMWIDVQGYEGFAFSGARRLLSRGLPTVSEISPFCLRRAGMSTGEFIGIVSEYWTHYWLGRPGGFVKYPIDDLNLYVDELGGRETSFGNVVFVRDV
jgi:FkbM family methyltransferase